MLKKNDHDIKQQVMQELMWDSHVGLTNIGVKVDNGVVTLSGPVESYAKKIAAQEAAHRVLGVLDVANDLEVRLANAPNDTEIAKAVRNALQWNVWMVDEEIESTVSNGVVTLEGNVAALRQREDAERAVRRLNGVRAVNNKIKVKPTTADAEELRLNIEEALERRADREAEHLRIEVNNDTVDIWGRVHSWQEKRAVLGSIIHARGVNKVNDHLRIDPYF
jgi:osmotically-inducible protein OsmY